MSKNKPYFSVVIPTFNRARYIKRAVQSIIGQTFLDYEIIVVDDDSTDNTSDVINLFNKFRIKYIKNNKRVGAAGARNEGVAVSTGQFIAFLDSDDEALPSWLEKTQKKIKQLPPNWGVIYPQYLIKNESTGVLYLKAAKQKEGNIYKNLLRGEGIPVGTPGAVLSKITFEKIGGFDVGLWGFHDVDLWYRISENYTFHFISEPLIVVHHHENPRLMGDIQNRKRGAEIFLKKWEEEIIKIAGIEAFNKRKSQFNRLSQFALVMESARVGNRMSAFKLLFHSFINKKINFPIFIKGIFYLVLGPYCSDHVKRIKGNIAYMKRIARH